MKEMITVFMETRHGDKPRPSRSVSTFMTWTRWMVERVNSRVLGDAKNRFAFGVNAPLDSPTAWRQWWGAELFNSDCVGWIFRFSLFIPFTSAPFDDRLKHPTLWTGLYCVRLHTCRTSEWLADPPGFDRTQVKNHCSKKLATEFWDIFIPPQEHGWQQVALWLNICRQTPQADISMSCQAQSNYFHQYWWVGYNSWVFKQPNHLVFAIIDVK